MLRREGDPVDNHIKMMLRQCLFGRRQVSNIGLDLLRTFRHGAV